MREGLDVVIAPGWISRQRLDGLFRKGLGSVLFGLGRECWRVCLLWAHIEIDNHFGVVVAVVVGMVIDDLFASVRDVVRLRGQTILCLSRIWAKTNALKS